MVVLLEIDVFEGGELLISKEFIVSEDAEIY